MLISRRGFSLIELMVVVVLVAVLLSLAVPAFGLWIANAKIRSANESLQSGIRLAQAEAQRRYRQTVFFRTNQSTCATTTTATPTGTRWVVKSIALNADDAVEVIQCGAMTDNPNTLTALGPAAICFSTAGRMTSVANPDVGVGIDCVVNNSGVTNFFVQGNGRGDRRFRVMVNLAGNVRTCDRDKEQSAATPDGCPDNALPPT